jgi:hypothetical protein
MCPGYLRNTATVWIDEYEYYYKLECTRCRRLYRGHEIADKPYKLFWEDPKWKQYITLEKQKPDNERRKVNLEALNVCKSKSQLDIEERSVGSGRNNEEKSRSIGKQIYGSGRAHRPSARRVRPRRREKD